MARSAPSCFSHHVCCRGSPRGTTSASLPNSAESDGTLKTQRTSVDHYLSLLGVTGEADQLPSHLSLGTQQCVSLARALSIEPRFLLLDEPLLHSSTR